MADCPGEKDAANSYGFLGVPGPTMSPDITAKSGLNRKGTPPTITLVRKKRFVVSLIKNLGQGYVMLHGH